jgi:hypothetical protein
MRSARSSLASTVLSLAIVTAGPGCATSPSAYLNRDEPINRTTGAGLEYRGTVVRVDQPQRVVVLDDGRMYRIADNQAVLINGQPAVLERIQPGTPVTIVSGAPVVHRDGQYVAVAPEPVVAPGSTVVALANGSVIRLRGHVADVDRDGDVKVRLVDGSAFEFRAPPGTIAREGEPVTIDLTFGAIAPVPSPR